MFFFLKPIKWAIKLFTLLVFAAIVFVVYCGVGVVRAEGGSTVASPSAIVVTGSSVVGTALNADLLGRLQAALTLYQAHTASSVVVAGPGATATSTGVPAIAASWLRAEGVSNVQQVSTSNASEYSAIAGAVGRGATVLVVTDAVDAKWTLNAASSAGLHAGISIVPGSKKLFVTDLGAVLRESTGVAAGRLIGPSHAVWAAN